MRLAILLLAFSCAAEAASGAKGTFAPGPAPSSASNGFTRGGSGQVPPDRRAAGPLDPKRKVNEQDCSKPVDLSAGNLKCK